MPKWSAKGTSGSLAYVSNTAQLNSVTWVDTKLTNSSGIVTFYPTIDGTASGAALFSSILSSSIQVTIWAAIDRTYIVNLPVVAADNKSITVQIKQNGSLLSLGLLPFTTAAAGVNVTLSFRGIQ